MAKKYPTEWTKPYAEDTRRRLLARYGSDNPVAVVRAIEASRDGTEEGTIAKVRKALAAG